ncbi:MAG: exodeoxyribonuclease V subunit beta [Pseudomonadales bacterium]|nr:exodeoxyribonuclease V subunit beta [Pseudomonadales bacterium]MDG1443729.1 exodeoxyribonuclease V subunit beta [Pseudomonadales bacterium]
MTQLITGLFPLTGHQLIEASAGTGKTYTITNLYLRLILGHDDDAQLRRSPLAPNQILVLTFTIAATDELRHRVRQRLVLAREVFSGEAVVTKEDDEFLTHLYSSSADKPRDRKLLTAALQMMDEASIFTIHSFCSRVLTEHSFETGTLFDQDLEGDKDRLMQMAAEDCFRSRILTLPATDRNIALGRWRNPTAVLQEMRPYLARHNLTIKPSFLDVSELLPALTQDDTRAKEMWLADDIEQRIIDCGYNKTKMSKKRFADIRDYCHSERLDPSAWIHWSKDNFQSAVAKATTPLEHEIFQLIESIYQRAYVVEQIEYNLWHTLFNAMRDNLALYKRQLSQLTLDDLLASVHEVLQGENGSPLATRLSGTWPVAMIDEFQDTDDLQYGIFSAIYPNSNDIGLFFIGDPKQAIYQFRGADIYTYINAKRQVTTTTDSTIQSLSTNWRSTPAMVQAVNHLFGATDVFGNDADIPFELADAAAPNLAKSFTIGGEHQTPFSITVANPADGKTDDITQAAMEDAAETTAELLSLAQRDGALVNGKPLQAGQIAFLVRTKKHARMARQSLSARGIRSVYLTQDSIFNTDTAKDIRQFLLAVIEPNNEGAIKAALATQLMQNQISHIAALDHDVYLQQSVLSEFQEYHRLWSSIDIAAAINHLIRHRKLSEKWLSQVDGERQITNLRHLAELLQTRSVSHPGQHQLVNWFSRELSLAQEFSNEDSQLRLESDQHLVQIVTMHAAKGLEYDIVMIPVSGFGVSARKPKTWLVHEQTEANAFAPVLHIKSGDHEQLAAKEAFDEDMRLLYVAFTRAKYKCYLGLPNYNDLHKYAIAKLLGLGDESCPWHESLTKLPAALFTQVELKITRTSYLDQTVPDALVAPAALPSIDNSWRVHSYTGLTRNLSRNSPEADIDHPKDIVAGFGDDEPETTKVASPTAEFSRFTFPRGARIGIALHDLMEHLAFHATAAEITAVAREYLPRFGLLDNQDEWSTVLEGWLVDILETSMSQDVDFCLADIQSKHRLNELEFHFPAALTQEFISTIQAAGYLEQHRSLSIAKVEGMMTGFIDLIVQVDGKFYLIDYKSNDLGSEQSLYEDEQLNAAMLHHQYDLQYLIYTVALNRYLAQSMENYDYDQHFGGVCYLFLRGMNRSNGSGVFYDMPPRALIEELDELVK